MGIRVGAAGEGVQVKQGGNTSSLEAGTKSDDSGPCLGVYLRNRAGEGSAGRIGRTESEVADREANGRAVEGLSEVGDIGIGEGCGPVILPSLACSRNTIDRDRTAWR